ncbi:MAG TPA: GNAT family N-acetyltransferase [Candidatus Dormibacteraeota bacterium]
MTLPHSPTIRRATPDDAEACHAVMWASVTDLARRHAVTLDGSAAEWWAGGESLHRFLAAHAAEWWLAQEPRSGDVIGYARSIARGGLLELTEFFVLPGHQSAGVGRSLLERAFPAGRGEVRSIIATTDMRAQSRYVRAGTVARFPFFSLVGTPAHASMDGDLTARVIDVDAEPDRHLVRGIESAVLEYARDDADIQWLLGDRQGILYLRGDQPAGFAFVGERGVGPVAVLDSRDTPGILLDVEERACTAGVARLDFHVPAPNEVATRHLLSRGFQLDPWINLQMSSRPFGRFDRFITFGPPMFL